MDISRPFLILVIGLLSGHAPAATLVDNFSVVTQYNEISASERGAQAFRTGSDSYIITEAAIIGYMLSPTQQIALKIYSDSNGKPNTAVATLFSGTTGQAGFHTNFSFRTPSVFSNLEVELLPDTMYWLVFENRSTTNLWSGYTPFTGSTENFGPGYIAGSKLSQGLTGNTWLNNGRDYGYRIQAVPEPSTTTLLVFSVGAVVALRRRRLRA